MTAPEEVLEGATWETAPDQKRILTSMQQNLTRTDGKIDALTYRIDRKLDRLDGHAECLDQLERRVSEADAHSTVETA
ncbi:hypothetical protein NDU88_000836 [Pleurodeles waltl]|uniref:Uncharacterized protein n=1 Tax=Pleurodeles waltl TaxID=8319 RepID=A0AAV7Q2B3_PLEWA|nr:hypothetical protein NDU88_000836 [Pleurodeles waltl]